MSDQDKRNIILVDDPAEPGLVEPGTRERIKAHWDELMLTLNRDGTGTITIIPGAGCPYHEQTNRRTTMEEVEQGAVECPNCGSGYLHPVITKVIDRKREDGEGIVTTVINGEVTQETDPDPPGRRNSVVIVFSCEDCDAEPELEMLHHKGQTYRTWRWDPADTDDEDEDFDEDDAGADLDDEA